MYTNIFLNLYLQKVVNKDYWSRFTLKTILVFQLQNVMLFQCYLPFLCNCLCIYLGEISLLQNCKTVNPTPFFSVIYLTCLLSFRRNLNNVSNCALSRYQSLHWCQYCLKCWYLCIWQMLLFKAICSALQLHICILTFYQVMLLYLRFS